MAACFAAERFRLTGAVECIPIERSLRSPVDLFLTLGEGLRLTPNNRYGLPQVARSRLGRRKWSRSHFLGFRAVGLDELWPRRSTRLGPFRGHYVSRLVSSLQEEGLRSTCRGLARRGLAGCIFAFGVARSFVTGSWAARFHRWVSRRLPSLLSRLAMNSVVPVVGGPVVYVEVIGGPRSPCFLVRLDGFAP